MNEFNLPKRQPEMVPDFVRALPEGGIGALALFDADGTLWTDDVADDFTKWMIVNNNLHYGNKWDEYLRIYRDDHEEGCRFLLSLYEGVPLERFYEQNLYWWREVAKRNWVVEVLESLYWLAERGYTIWIVTGSPTGTMMPLTQFLPVHKIVGMDFETDQSGIISGKLSGISCTGEGKAEKVLSMWDNKAPIVFGVGNGSLDGAMIELARGVSWSVYPNPSFYELSVSKGWHILPRPDNFVEESKLI